RCTPPPDTTPSREQGRGPSESPLAREGKMPRDDGIGASVRRKEDYRFITGQGNYTDDIERPGQLYAVFVHSPHAHARIRRIDAEAARKMPGVAAVFVGADLAADNLGGIPCGW